jgi:hypothetical protein
MKLNNGKVMTLKDVPQGAVFTDKDGNIYFRTVELKTLDGTNILSVFVEAVVSGFSLKPGDAAVNLKSDDQVTAYF